MIQRLLPLATAAALALFAAGSALGGEERTPWTGSRLVGTPDPPPPFAVEVAFPKLRFRQPIALVAAPGSSRVFVGEVGGKLLAFENDPGTDRTSLVLDLAAARPGGFGSLFGVAFHPRFAENRQVFLCYTLGDGKPEGTRVSRFTASRDDPPRIDPKSERVLLTWLSGGHNGGCLQFDRDGFLLISTGDAAAPAPPDPLATGQDLGDLLSSILRIDVDGEDAGRPYRIPRDNPFLDTEGARPEVWAYGFRNPWRMSVDRSTGDLWVGDVGWELWEMIHRVERGGNYGWSLVEGHQPVRPEGRRGPTPIRPPVVEHPHSEAASITGGYVYRGDRLKDLVGAYVYGDFQTGRVWALRHDGQKVTWKGEVAATDLQLVSFGEDSAGELYLLDFERTGRVYRLVPNPARASGSDFPRKLSATGLFASTAEHRPAPGVVPFAIHAALWADGTVAERLLAIPGDGRIAVNGGGGWELPEGSVLARTVSIEGVVGEPSRRRLETQVLHREGGTWRPYTYAWDDDGRDASLVDAGGTTRTVPLRDAEAPSGRREMTYRIAARSECLICHNPWAGGGGANFGRQSASPLAFRAAQLHGKATDAGDDQLRILKDRGYFAGDPSAAHARLADPRDESADLATRARSYLQVNCAHCHQPNAGGTTTISLLAGIGLEETRAVGAKPVQGTFGLSEARIIAPGEPERSVLYARMVRSGAGHMPRIGAREIDARGSRLIADWIAGMPRPADGGEAQAAPPKVAADAPAEALRALISSPSGALTLVRAIDRGEVPREAARRAASLAQDRPAEVRDLLERFLPESERLRRLGDAFADSEVLALSGSSERGRALFLAESGAQCRACHRIGGVGSTLGPELDRIGAKYGKPDLLRHIREPSLAIEPKYATRVVATKDGRVVTGLLREETPEAIVLRDAQDRPVTIPRSEIEQIGTRPDSLMPQGLLRDLTAQQAADLLEFLAAQKGER